MGAYSPKPYNPMLRKSKLHSSHTAYKLSEGTHAWLGIGAVEDGRNQFNWVIQ